MKVQELRELLKNLPDDDEIGARGQYWGNDEYDFNPLSNLEPYPDMDNVWWFVYRKGW